MLQLIIQTKFVLLSTGILHVGILHISNR